MTARRYSVEGRAPRAVAFGTLGLLALWIGIAGFAPAAFMAGSRAGGIAGVALAAAGAFLFVLALRIGLRGRRRRVQVAVTVVLGYAALQWVVVPAVTAGLVTHAPRTAVPAASTLGLPGARDVVFPAGDGVRLAGWYVPSRNGAVVIVLHGSHGDRSSTTPYVRLLSRAGYGVLAYDARGHGRSGGHTNALGWRGEDDLAGAVAFLRGQPDTDAVRIGALGLSMGAEEALRAAAEGVPLRAIVADGAGASTLGDQRIASHGLLSPIALSADWLGMREIELLSRDGEPAPLKSVVAMIAAPTLLIASSRKDERRIDEVYRAQIGASAQLWFVPDAGHTQALSVHPRAYAARVTAFFDRALG